jgi:hypothetical protein
MPAQGTVIATAGGPAPQPGVLSPWTASGALPDGLTATELPEVGIDQIAESLA